MSKKFKKLDAKVVDSLGITPKPRDIKEVTENWMKRLEIDTGTDKEEPTKQEK